MGCKTGQFRVTVCLRMFVQGELGTRGTLDSFDKWQEARTGQLERNGKDSVAPLVGFRKREERGVIFVSFSFTNHKLTSPILLTAHMTHLCALKHDGGGLKYQC